MKKTTIYRLAMVIGIALCVVSYAFQTDTTPAQTATVPPWWTFLAMFLGILAHWYSEYREGQHDLNFLAYLYLAWGKSLSMVVGCLALLGTSWLSNPAAFEPFNLGGLISAWTIGWTADSALNGTPKASPASTSP